MYRKIQKSKFQYAALETLPQVAEQSSLRGRHATRYTLHTRGGYTLIELMVAVTLFTIVAMVSIAALISVNDANKKAQTMRAIIDNLNFAVENMARNLRVGTSYYCEDGSTSFIYSLDDPALSAPSDCSLSGSTWIAFKDFNGKLTVYAFDGGNKQIKKGQEGSNFLPITPHTGAAIEPLSVDYLRFYVSGAPPSDGKEPRAVIVVGGTARYNNAIQSKFQIQTSVSQRKIDS